MTTAKAKQKELKPVYLIHGEKKLIEDALARLKKRIALQFDLDFNYDQFDGASTNVSEIINAASTLPFMSDRRLVVVKNVDKISASEAAKLANYIENPVESTCLVLVVTSINKTSRLCKAVEKTGEIAEYKLKDKPIVWIKKQFSENGKLVSDAVARYILQVVGQDLQKLTQEIEKVSLYFEDDRIIDPADIEVIVSKSVEVSIFELVDAIGERNKQKALTILRGLIEQKEAPLSILALIARHFRMLLRTRVWLEAGRDTQYLIEHLAGEDNKKLPHFVVSKYKEQSRNFSINDLKEMFEKLLEADIALKTSSQQPEAVLELLVV